MTDFFAKYPALKPIAQSLVASAIFALTTWLVGQGLLAPVQQKQQEQTEQLTTQNTELRTQNKALRRSIKLQEAEAKYWAVPIPVEDQ